jgi:hypothetical protein
MKGALMPYGSGQAIRHALIQAKPWQRYLIGVVMVAVGVVLVLIGHIAGALLALAEVLLLGRMARHRFRRPSASAMRGTAQDGEGP